MWSAWIYRRTLIRSITVSSVSYTHLVQLMKTTFNEYSANGQLMEPVSYTHLAEHKDIEDDGQTVLITERIIKIHTTATDKDGNKELEAGKEVTIIDTVTLEGLEVGTQYKLVGWQMLKEENAEDVYKRQGNYNSNQCCQNRW